MGGHEQEELRMRYSGELGAGLSLWGNTPAVDLINLVTNENDLSKDYTIALPASGDLRHVIKTVNSLPERYTGELTILLNDLEPSVSSRNLILLMLLGNIQDEAVAADMALHFWYSVFVPTRYKKGFWEAVALYLQFDNAHAVDGIPPFPLTPTANVSYPIVPATEASLRHCGLGESLDEDAARKEYHRVRNLPSRVDFFSRMYGPLRPSHRVAFQEYRRTGVIMPFGANIEHFTEPNPSLFRSSDKRWGGIDTADPLHGWDQGDVVASGRAHGTSAEDIYGCFYFYISDQLRLFHRRLHEGKFRVSFRIYCSEARQLARILQNNTLRGHGLLASTRFDRIMVSNIMDHSYVGIRETLKSWGPLLSNRQKAVFLGYFMNWGVVQKGSTVEESEDPGEEERILKILSPRYKIPVKFPGIRDLKLMNDWITMSDEAILHYENSRPFTRFLKLQGLDEALRAVRLKLRETHTILPHRYGAPLTAPSSALPEFANEDTLYYWRRLVGYTWAERFVEFSPL